MPRDNFYNNNALNYNENSYPAGYTISPTVPADASTPDAYAAEPQQWGAVENAGDNYAATEPMDDYNDNDQPKTEVDDIISHEGEGEIRAVVGWLVGIKGSCIGHDFRLHSGRNYIGRGDNLDVQLNDNKISREPAVQVVFDPESLTFLVSSCDRTSTMSYLNGKVIMSVQELKAYDRIRLGGCELMFVPLCGEHFTWTNNEI